jgi:hypothetical protein
MFGMEGLAAALGTAAAVALPLALAGVAISVIVMNWPEILGWLKDASNYVAGSGVGKWYTKFVENNPLTAAEIAPVNELGTPDWHPWHIKEPVPYGPGPFGGEAKPVPYGPGPFGGEATLKVEVTGPDWMSAQLSLINKIGGLSIGTTGSTGKSMPEVSPLSSMAPLQSPARSASSAW